MGRRIAATAAMAALLLAAPASAAGIGRVERLAGEVRIGPGGRLAPAGAGSTLAPGDEIRTGREGRARLAFAGGAVVELGPGGRLVAAGVGPDPATRSRSTVLRLEAGVLRAMVPDHGPHGGLSIETPMAAIATRGGDLLVEAGPNATAIFAVRGSASVVSRSAAMRGRLGLGPRDGIRLAENGGSGWRPEWTRRMEALTRVP